MTKNKLLGISKNSFSNLHSLALLLQRGCLALPYHAHGLVGMSHMYTTGNGSDFALQLYLSKNDICSLTMAESSNLTDRPLPELIRQLAVPASIGYIFHTLYNVVDTWYAGRFISDEAIAALTLSFPLFFIIISFFAFF